MAVIHGRYDRLAHPRFGRKLAKYMGGKFTEVLGAHMIKRECRHEVISLPVTSLPVVVVAAGESPFASNPQESARLEPVRFFEVVVVVVVVSFTILFIATLVNDFLRIRPVYFLLLFYKHDVFSNGATRGAPSDGRDRRSS